MLIEEAPPSPRNGGIPSHAINVIHGGQAAGGVVSSSREIYAAMDNHRLTPRKRVRPSTEGAISFSEEDLEHVANPRCDALVITPIGADHHVERFLVDIGSSSNFIALRVVETLGKSEKDLAPVEHPLVEEPKAVTTTRAMDSSQRARGTQQEDCRPPTPAPSTLTEMNVASISRARPLSPVVAPSERNQPPLVDGMGLQNLPPLIVEDHESSATSPARVHRPPPTQPTSEKHQQPYEGYDPSQLHRDYPRNASTHSQVPSKVMETSNSFLYYKEGQGTQARSAFELVHRHSQGVTFTSTMGGGHPRREHPSQLQAESHPIPWTEPHLISQHHGEHVPSPPYYVPPRGAPPPSSHLVGAPAPLAHSRPMEHEQRTSVHDLPPLVPPTQEEYHHPHEEYHPQHPRGNLPPNAPRHFRSPSEVMEALNSILYYRERRGAQARSASGPARQHSQEASSSIPMMGGEHPHRERPLQSHMESHRTYGMESRSLPPPHGEYAPPPLHREQSHRAPPPQESTEGAPAPRVPSRPREGERRTLAQGPSAQVSPKDGFSIRNIEEIVSRMLYKTKVEGLLQLRDKTSHPFTKELRSIVLPKTVTASKIAEYKGKGDPIQHVQRHEASLLGRGHNDDHTALLFPATLADSASHWFFGLPQESVSSWDDLKTKFIQRYLGERQLLKGSNALDDVKQHKDETLAEYYTRFNHNLTEIDAIFSDGEIIRAFQRNLTGRFGYPLADYMARKPIDTMEHLAAKVKSFIDMERVRINRKDRNLSLQFDATGKKGGNRPSLPLTSKPPFSRRKRGHHRPREAPETHYTPLTKELSVILVEMRKLGLDTPPPRTDGSAAGDQLQHWCEYHERKGHHTEHCHKLKGDIERLLSGGHLTQFMKNDKKRARTLPSQSQPQGKGKEKVGNLPPPPPHEEN